MAAQAVHGGEGRLLVPHQDPLHPRAQHARARRLGAGTKPDLLTHHADEAVDLAAILEKMADRGVEAGVPLLLLEKDGEAASQRGPLAVARRKAPPASSARRLPQRFQLPGQPRALRGRLLAFPLQRRETRLGLGQVAAHLFLAHGERLEVRLEPLAPPLGRGALLPRPLRARAVPRCGGRSDRG